MSYVMSYIAGEAMLSMLNGTVLYIQGRPGKWLEQHYGD